MTVSNQSNRTTGDQKPSLAEVIMQEWKRDNRVREAANDMLRALEAILRENDERGSSLNGFLIDMAREATTKATGVEP